MKQLLIIILLLKSITANATTYYVSNSGNDSNSGLTEVLPWKTIDKVNSFNFSAGDQILFKRGDTFYGGIVAKNVGRAGTPLTYGAYGSGDKPIIIGLQQVTEWTDLGFNIWESTNAVSTLPDLKTVIINGKSTPMGRFPNGDASYPFLPNFNTFQSSTGTGIGASSITSSSLIDGPDWTGAEVVTRATQWSFHRDTITDQTDNTLYFSGIGGGLTAGWGFFIQNDIKTLDQQGEWYYNPSTKKISVYSTTMPTDVQVSTVETLFYLFSNIPAINYTDIDSINFIGANTNNIKISGNLVFSVTNCDVSYSGLEGLLLFGGGIQGGTINNNTFYNNGSSAISETGASDNLTITNNRVNMSGVISVYKQDDYTNGGIQFASDDALVQYNSIDSSAYCGLNFNGANVQILNNFINHSALVRADAAGIYTGFANNAGKKIDGNVILNSIGNKRGTKNNDLFCFGIYTDDLGNNMQITNNTIANCATGGIYIHNSNNITVRSNTIYNCGAANSTEFSTMWGNGGIAIDGNADIFASSLYDNVVKKNTVFAVTPYQHAIWYYSAESGNNVENFGIIDSNYYEKINNPSTLIKFRQASTNSEISLATWQSSTSMDLHTLGSPKSVTNPDSVIFVFNPTDQDSTVALSYNYIDVDNTSYDGEITLPAYSGRILIQDGSAIGALPPTVTTSGNQTIIISTANVTSSGTAADGQSITSYAWTKISGAGAITSPSSQNTGLTGLYGTSVFRVTVTQTDNQTAYSELTITVTLPPTVEVGSDTIIYLGSPVTLNGSVESAVGHTSTYLWTFQSGSGTFDDATALNTTARDMPLGDNILRLTATQDDSQTGYADRKITVINISPPATYQDWIINNKVELVNSN